MAAKTKVHLYVHLLAFSVSVWRDLRISRHKIMLDFIFLFQSSE